MNPSKTIIIALGFMCLTLYSNSFKAQDSISNASFRLGIRPSWNHTALVLDFRLNHKNRLQIQTGFQWRYISEYHRYSRIRLGIYPTLASFGPSLEVGIQTIENSRLMYFGLSYELTYLERGVETYHIWADGFFQYTDSYQRFDHKVSFKINRINRVHRMLEVYYGGGVRVSFVDYDYYQSYPWSRDFKMWANPVFHLGLNFYIVNGSG